jgi:hypothetical protein
MLFQVDRDLSCWTANRLLLDRRAGGLEVWLDEPVAAYGKPD